MLRVSSPGLDYFLAGIVCAAVALLALSTSSLHASSVWVRVTIVIFPLILWWAGFRLEQKGTLYRYLLLASLGELVIWGMVLLLHAR